MQPPPELIKQWVYEVYSSQNHGDTRDVRFARLAYAAGADAQLEACVEWVQGFAECGDSLRAAMRPKPPSLKEQALEALGPEPRPKPVSDDSFKMSNAGEIKRHQLIRQALELIPDDN